MKTLKILVADAHLLVREALTVVLDGHRGFQVVGQAARDEEVYDLVEELNPHLVLMDISLPGLGGAGMTKRIKQTSPQVKVLALSSCEDEVYLHQLLSAGANGYVLKRTSVEELVQAVQVVGGGDEYIDTTLAALIAPASDRAPMSLQAETLSNREQNVLRFTAQGLTHKEIGNLLCISKKTVETYKARSMNKLHLHSRAEVVRYALVQGWLQEEVQPF